MKFCKKICMTGIFLFLATGCSYNENTGKEFTNKNTVQEVINSQLETEKSQEGTAGVTIAQEVQQPQKEIFEATSDTQLLEGTVDYDLTAMSSDMVYATVYQMMVYPDKYIGKTVRMSGNFYATYYEPTKKYYFYCIIQDALACCAQGMEFVWDDGNHIYPDEYPSDNIYVVVEGTFETYREEGDENLYCRLTNATMNVPE